MRFRQKALQHLSIRVRVEAIVLLNTRSLKDASSVCERPTLMGPPTSIDRRAFIQGGNVNLLPASEADSQFLVADERSCPFHVVRSRPRSLKCPPRRSPSHRPSRPHTRCVDTLEVWRCSIRTQRRMSGLSPLGISQFHHFFLILPPWRKTRLPEESGRMAERSTRAGSNAASTFSRVSGRRRGCCLEGWRKLWSVPYYEYHTHPHHVRRSKYRPTRTLGPYLLLSPQNTKPQVRSIHR